VIQIDFFTEEESARIVLYNILPLILPTDVCFEVYSFNGRGDLLKKLPSRLRAYRHDPLKSNKVVILMDRDSHNCRDVKSQLELIVEQSGLTSKRVNSDEFQVVTRVVIEELEAWFFGDIAALNQGYPSIPITLAQKRGMQVADEISDPAGRLLRLLKKEYSDITKLPKLEVAQKVSSCMNPHMNTSQSFNAFIDGVMACCECSKCP